MIDLSFKAFVDASAGAAGALFSSIIFYPLDVAKTKKQIHVKSDEKKIVRTISDAEARKKEDLSIFQLCVSIYEKQGINGLFLGLAPKALHTAISSFTYFYWYALLKEMYVKRVKKLDTASNLLIASAAGAVNMSMTLPIEVVTTRAQASNEPRPIRQFIKDIFEEGGVLGFWKGFVASLILTSNPAINYTIFDRLKDKIQALHMRRTGAARPRSLTVFEAFVLAAIAKSIATILTYPLIRAKVLMQAQSKRNSKDECNGLGDSLTTVFKNIGVRDGALGYYKGCSAQIFNTVLKSAILLMTKEQITTYTMKVLYALNKKNK